MLTASIVGPSLLANEHDQKGFVFFFVKYFLRQKFPETLNEYNLVLYTFRFASTRAQQLMLPGKMN
jgi:hypothetical protein